ncbi:MAG: alanine racemase [Christensenellales bacterium]
MNLEISLENLRYNARAIKSRTFGAKIIAVVKANAYGHGAVKIAHTLRRGLRLRRGKQPRSARTCYGGDNRTRFSSRRRNFRLIVPENVIPTISDEEGIKRAAKKCKFVAIAVNTGMNRYGCDPKTLKTLVSAATENGLNVRHVFTHIADESDKESSNRQLSAFIGATASLKIESSVAATCALNLGRPFCSDCVRAGIGLYGYGADNLKPIASAFAPIVAVRKIKKGERVGYGDFFADKDIKIAVVAAGYADGLMRRRRDLFATVCGIKCRAVGQIAWTRLFRRKRRRLPRRRFRLFYRKRREYARSLYDLRHDPVRDSDVVRPAFGQNLRVKLAKFQN